VHNYWYGTPAEPIYSNLALGKDVLLQIDVQGAERIRAFIKDSTSCPIIPQQFVDIFIMPPSLEEIKKRLERRGEDSKETIERRIVNAQRELEQWNEYKYIIVNDNLTLAYQKLKAIITAEHCKVLKKNRELF
jgi:guanylate kinase